MTAHWFDTLSKSAARFEALDRRSFLAVGTVLGLGVVNGRASAESSSGQPRVLAANDASRQAGAMDREAIGNVPNILGSMGDSHVRRTAGALIIHEVATEKSGLSLYSYLAFNRTTQNVVLTTTINSGSALVAKIEATVTRGGAGAVAINYGALVSGVSNVTASTKNGKTFQGTMDGRPFTIGGRASSMKEVQFLDRAPPPQIAVDRKLGAAIADLGARANAVFSAPRAALAQAALAQATLAHPAYGEEVTAPSVHTKGGPKFHRHHVGAPGHDWYEPSDDVVDCTHCEDDCNALYHDLLPDWLWICPPCAAAEVLNAGIAWTGCQVACQVPGGGCLPNPCGSFTTCAKNDTCFSFGDGRLCCPSPSALCNSVCCGKDIVSCAPDGGCGCTTGQQACGNDCCDPGQVCKEGVCCSPGVVVCNGVCCQAGQVCHAGSCCNQASVCGPVCCNEATSCADANKGICCGFDSPWCGGTCCPLGSHCINGKCCDPNSVCGGICCPNGTTCADPATHKCSPCPANTAPCFSTNGVGLCCQPGVECCGNTCCKPLEACQQSGNTYICVPMRIQ